MGERRGDSTSSPDTLADARKKTFNDELQQSATIDYRYELIRKTIHLFSLSIPIIYSFISKELALQLLVPMTLWFLVVDIARFVHKPTADIFYRWFGWLLRKHERDALQKRLNGATYVLIASTLCVFVFPKLLVITALSILIISDTTSALVGRRFGKRPFFEKSVEGTIAFFVTAVLVVFVTPKLDGLPMEYIIGILGAAVGAAVESAPLRLDDNLSVPISICAVMWGLYALLLPSLDLAAFVV